MNMYLPLWFETEGRKGHIAPSRVFSRGVSDGRKAWEGIYISPKRKVLQDFAALLPPGGICANHAGLFVYN